MATILILEDNEDLADGMRGFLVEKDHTVTVTHCVTDAFARLEDHEYDLLILDWDLPDGTGLHVCRGYRDRGGLGVVLMITGHSSPEYKVAGLTAGADDYLTKPVNIQEFGARITALLRRTAINKRAEAPPVFDETLIGRTFNGSYRILSVLGQGTMGIVYKASHNTIQRTTAIKILSGRFEGLGERLRFEREAQAMNLLDHPNLIKIHDFGITEHNVPFIIMEFVEGKPLSELLSTQGTLPPKQALPIFIDICKGLEHAHANAIVHRDLKPANIMISEDCAHAKIVDLGIAKFVSDEASCLVLTSAGEIFGTPFYMSPEQATNKTLDQRSDIFSLGCVFYEALTGDVPFTGDSFVDVTNAKMQGPRPSICREFPLARFPMQLDRIIQTALQVSPENRQSSVTELNEQLIELQTTLEKGPVQNDLGPAKKFLRTLEVCLKGKNIFSKK